MVGFRFGTCNTRVHLRLASGAVHCYYLLPFYHFLPISYQPPRAMTAAFFAALKPRSVRARRSSPPIRFLLVLSLLTAVAAPPSGAWVYPEHRAIALRAVLKLDPSRRAVLDGLWADARRGHEQRLSASPADTAQGEEPAAIDWCAWPAISGDHSCSSADLLRIVLQSDWILDAAGVTATLGKGLVEAKDRSSRINALRDSDIGLQRVDPDYATRAGSNNVHFLLPRKSADTGLREYATTSVGQGSELNAFGTYIWYHYSALMKALRLSRERLEPAEREALARAALADEAFALHFLEDVFSAGHVTGTWGNAAFRKGTHDYYSERGFEGTTWRGRPVVLAGDAWMREEDADIASDLVRVSIEQVLDAAVGTGPATVIAPAAGIPAAPDTFNVCSNTVQPAREYDRSAVPFFSETLLDMPAPALGPGLGELPRFRAELGPFLGLASSVFGGSVYGGFSSAQSEFGGIGGLSLALRMGLGLEGIINESGDGLVFLDVGVRQDAPSTSSLSDAPELDKLGSITAAIPSRGAITFRLRAPFWLIPGDLLVAGPILLLASPSTLSQMAVQAGSGGLIPWQAGINTFLGRIQFMVGREIGVSMFGYGEQSTRFIVPDPSSTTGGAMLIGLRTIQIDLPLIEYRPFRTFSADQASSLVLQLHVGWDFPTRVEVIEPVGSPEPDLEAVGYVGLRLAFDWRSYLGSPEGAHR